MVFHSFITYPTGTYKAFKMVVKTQKIVLSISDDYNATSSHDKANLITYLCTKCGLLLQVVLNSVLINPFCDSGTVKYRPQMVLLIFLCSFQYASRKKLLFRYQVFLTALDYYHHS